MVEPVLDWQVTDDRGLPRILFAFSIPLNANPMIATGYLSPTSRRTRSLVNEYALHSLSSLILRTSNTYKDLSGMR